ncbi:MAG TPA: S8 family peptidase [Zoogloea sp.]|uniref:S8 family peptidase n=1 Tax=Zoogloea sp. TaxID=49181 RepID=UPI002D0D7F88|nr:S8 family peptidase [Zoogloea sp.]HMW52959.1 S8 family peptidase [Rhodocyclaceae bacterium]HMZ77844.1 S8 family peptidase [Rhodocyclaceae bacterium]HNA68988.1 S8 family peptidase [Rhodocyclaceae bacterium]HNH18080.1 S8 family peptidase [Zoogloea sp.]HNI49627.1 S8 family peptidase [Zoogloea sp.]
MHPSLSLPLLALAFAAPLAQADAPRNYIVQFHDTAVQSPPRALVRDHRVNSDPSGWAYLDARVMERLQSIESRHGIVARHAFSHVLKGFAATLTDAQLARLKSDPAVMSIEEDLPVQIVGQTIPWGISTTRATLSSTLAGNGSGAVNGVNVYVIDTGIAPHGDLNKVNHLNFTADGKNYDCHGHGTHVAGTIGARDDTTSVVGMAPYVRLTGVKVLDCTGSGSDSTVIKGLDWVTANAVKPAVANMSLGGGASSALDAAVTRAVNAGVVFAIAAGNSSAKACNYSPARVGGSLNGAITTAATDSSNKEASFSNYGSCVDTWAPGVSILSTYLNSGVATMSGTSMASPHVAGAAALYLARNPTASPAAVEAAIKQAAVRTGTVSKDGRAITRLDVIGF